MVGVYDDAEVFTITAGENDHQLSVTKGGTAYTDVTYSSDNTGVLTVDTDGKITTVNAGTSFVSVYVTGSADPIITKKITVKLPETFSITGESKVTIGSEIQLGIDKNYGTFTWSSSSDAIATVDNTGKVTGVAEGSVTITAERNDGVSIHHNISVIDGGVQFDITGNSTEFIIDKTKKVSKIEIEFDKNNIPSEDWKTIKAKLTYYDTWSNIYWPHDETLCELDFINDVGANKIKTNSQSDKVNISIDNYKVTIEINNPSNYDYSKGDGKLIISSSYNWRGKYRVVYLSESTTSLLSTSSTSSTMLLGAGEPRAAELIDTVTISGGSAGGWEKVIENLPVYDSNGNSYVYWAVEDPTFTGYDTAYQFSDGSSESISWIDATSPNENGEFVITVRNTKNQEQVFEMPSTGGEGTTKFYYTGGALVLLSAFAGGNRFRRRFKERRKK